MPRRARFFTHRRRIASVATRWFDEELEEHEGLAFAWDPVKLDDAAVVPVNALPRKDAEAVTAFAKKERCACPACSGASPRRA